MAGKLQNAVKDYLATNPSKTVDDITKHVETLNISKATGPALRQNVYNALNAGCKNGMFTKTNGRPKYFSNKKEGTVEKTTAPVITEGPVVAPTETTTVEKPVEEPKPEVTGEAPATI